jgi:hypothetical protein
MFKKIQTILFATSLFCPVIAQTQQTQRSTRSLFENCWQSGVINKQKSCIAHIYLTHVDHILEIMRKPDPKPLAFNEATLQAMLSDLLFRQQQKSQAYKATCADLRRATIDSDSVAQQSTILICRALEDQEYADSMTMSALLLNVESSEKSIVEKAKIDAAAASATKDASRIMYMAASSLTYMLLDLSSGGQATLDMTKAERNALIAKTISIYKGQKAQKAKFVLEQNVELLRDFLQGKWKDLDDLKGTQTVRRSPS